MSEARPQSRNNFRLNPSGLGRLGLLPENILLAIIRFTYDYSRLEAQGILKRKRERVKKCLNHPWKPEVYVYQEPAILNSAQSLAVTNQRLYTLCSQWLWRHIEFPTLIPIWMSYWIRDILPKHGESVRSIIITLSENWYQPIDEDGTWPVTCDNIHSIHDGIVHCGISPENVIRLLTKCPQLAALKIILPQENPEEQARYQMLENRLVGYISHLPRLRHLGITSTFPFLNDCESRIVEHLPLLESFISSGIRGSSTPESKKLLGLSLSRCRYLTRLHLRSFDSSSDFSWSEQSWPEIITDLHLNSCNFSFYDLGIFVRRLAPQVTHLEVGFKPGARVSTAEEGDSSDSTTSIPAGLGNLPALKSLKIFDQNAKELMTIGPLPNLTHLTYYGLSSSTWPFFSKLVCEASFPKLKFIDLSFVDQLSPDNEWDIITAQENLYEVCLQKGIKIQVVSDGWNYCKYEC